VNLRFQAHLAAHPQEWGGGGHLIAAEVSPSGKVELAHLGAVAAFRVHDGAVERVARPHTLDEERQALGLPAPEQDLSRVVLRAFGSPNWKPEAKALQLEAGDRLALLTQTVERALSVPDRNAVLRGPLQAVAGALVSPLPLDEVGAALVLEAQG
jgi:hypothetical protein